MKKFLSSADGRREALEAEDRVATPAAAPVVKKNKGGRPKGSGTKLTVEVGRAIVAAIAAGNFPSVAARLAGVSIGTLERWLERGDKGEQPYADFAQALRKAEDEDHAAMVAIWKKAAPEDWRAAKEYLAKRYPEQWSDHAARLAVLGPEGDGGDNIGVGLHITLDLRDRPEWYAKAAVTP